MIPVTMAPIGTARAGEDGFVIRLAVPFRPGLIGLGGFSHATILWWADAADTAETRAATVIDHPYPGGPAELGVFATRSPARPNPIGLTVARVIGADPAAGTVRFDWFDLEDGTPVLDLKPYHPSADRVRDATVPGWCAGWPSCLEDSPGFDWAGALGGAG